MLKYADYTENALPFDDGFFPTVNHFFIQGLALAEKILKLNLIEKMSKTDLQLLKRNKEKLEQLCLNNDINFKHKFIVLSALYEYCEHKIDDIEVIQKFELASKHAKLQGFLLDKGIIYELTAKICLLNHKPSLALHYFEESLRVFEKWGAMQKVEHLKKTIHDCKVIITSIAS